jgi:hypothetical protein
MELPVVPPSWRISTRVVMERINTRRMMVH